MKLDLRKLFVVYKPTKHSVQVDVFDGRPDSLAGLFRQVKGGLTIEGVHAIYTTKSEAQKESERVLKRSRKFYKGLSGGIEKGEGYALFMSYVPASDKYKVHSKPKVYKTRKEAEKALNEAVRKQGFKRSELKILKY